MHQQSPRRSCELVLSSSLEYIQVLNYIYMISTCGCAGWKRWMRPPHHDKRGLSHYLKARVLNMSLEYVSRCAAGHGKYVCPYLRE